MKFMTPLRWKILAGYGVFALITVVLWKDLLSGWSLLMTFLSPVFAFFAALIALKFGVVLTALGTFLLAFASAAIGMLIAVSKMGIIKGLFLPWLLAGLQWMHRKSTFLQFWVARIYKHGKAFGERIFNWWQEKNRVDKILLLGFVGPLVLVVTFALLIKRFVYMFVSKKAAEQVVQRATKATVKNINKIPMVYKVQDSVKSRAVALKQERDKKLGKLAENQTDDIGDQSTGNG